MTAEEIVRKAAEDLVHANVKEIFQVQYGEKIIIAGDNYIAFPEKSYLSEDIYEISIPEAIDNDGTDITDALDIKNRQTTGFTVNSPRAGTLRWTTNLRTPQFYFWD